MGFFRELRRYAGNVLRNLDQPGMPAGAKWAKFVRNRFRAMVLLQGCCGHPGEPGC